MHRRHQIDAARQGRSAEIGVEKRRDAARPGDAKPNGRVFRAVRHQQADDVALADAVGHRPAGVAVAARVVGGVAQRLAIGDQGWPVPVASGEVLGGVGECPVAVPGHRRDDPQRSVHAEDEEPILPEVREKTHFLPGPPGFFRHGVDQPNIGWFAGKR